jgi:hypothetical protein
VPALVEVEDVEEDKEVMAELLKTLAEFTSMPSPELWPLSNVSAISMRDFASSATRRDTVFSIARSGKVRRR